mmetsp:Transcript_44760/g.132457  ORF Transcript_44760/g.132457 Transcript_44760/m.132457 type:complete len:176 (-) Transcript_44760:23-550(-)
MGQTASGTQGICCTQWQQASGSFGYGREVDLNSSELVMTGKLSDVYAPMGTSQGGSQEFRVMIDRRTGGKLGLDVDQLSGNVLIVDAIKEGLILSWNQAHPEQALRVGDFIVEVNGVRGDGMQLVQECRKNQFITLACRRRKGLKLVDEDYGLCRTKQRCSTLCQVPCTEAPMAS